MENTQDKADDVFATKQMTIAGKLAIFRNKTPKVPFYHTEFDGKIFTPALSEDTGPVYLGGTFETRPGDVFLVAYPKSGTHWLTYITNQIAKLPIKLDKEDYTAIGNIPFLERTTPEQLAMLPSPRYAYTHLPYHLIPGRNNHKVKYITIARNPKDVAVSQFNFMRDMKLIDFYGEWDEFLSLFMRGLGFGGSYFEFVLEWWKHREDKNVLFLKYEDMKKDVVKQIDIIANFLGYQLSQGDMEKIAKASTFKAMRENRVGTIESYKTVALREGKSFYRKGVVGDWQNYFSDEQLEEFNQWCHAHLKNTGLEFDFG